MREIEQIVLDYILEDVNKTLERLGISEKVTIANSEAWSNRMAYFLESKPIKVTPMIYRETKMDGKIYDMEAEWGKGLCPDRGRIIVADVGYQFQYFDGGSNGVDLGTAYYAIHSMNIIGENKEGLKYLIRKVKPMNL